VARLSRTAACEILRRVGAPPDADYHMLSFNIVDRLSQVAKNVGYRKPKTAGGSTARMFFSHLQKRCK